MGFSPQQLALLLLKKNPQVADSPMGRELLQAIQTGDNAKGEQIAMNLINAHGDTKESAMNKASQFFGLK